MELSWKQRIAIAARQRCDEETWEREHPEEAAARRTQREQLKREQMAEERLRNEKEQLDGTSAYLERCGLMAAEIGALNGILDDRPPMRHAREFWEGEKTFLLMCGRTGRGKTLAACSLALNCKLHFHHPDFGLSWVWPGNVSSMAHYCKAPDLARESHFGEDAIKSSRRLIGYRLLILDELGAETMNDPWKSRLENLVDDRMRAQRKTVLASNLSFADFKSRYGDRIARRIREHGDCHEYSEAQLKAVTQ